jgi:ketosteroid isomerase-like protein
VLKELTRQYIHAFNNKNLVEISELFIDSFILEDPVVKRLEGKENALKYIKDIFDSCSILEFKEKNIYQENSTTIIEFSLKLDDTILMGTDIIE